VHCQVDDRKTDVFEDVPDSKEALAALVQRSYEIHSLEQFALLNKEAIRKSASPWTPSLAPLLHSRIPAALASPQFTQVIPSTAGVPLA